jgi:hypothetical protein
MGDGMKLLISGASKTVSKYSHNPYIGQLMTPQAGNSYRFDIPTAADNAAYSNWDECKFIMMLDSLIGKELLWVSSPDVVGDAIATSELFDKWWVEIKQKRNLPISLVLQDGQEWIGLPDYDAFDAIFIGGTTGFKLGKYVRYSITKVKDMGKQVHMGRVNSFERLKYAMDIGCDSIDGTSMSMYPDVYIPKFLKFIEQYKRQEVLPL